MNLEYLPLLKNQHKKLKHNIRKITKGIGFGVIGNWYNKKITDKNGIDNNVDCEGMDASSDVPGDTPLYTRNA